jgi:hypothetical protein
MVGFLRICVVRGDRRIVVLVSPPVIVTETIRRGRHDQSNPSERQGNDRDSLDTDDACHQFAILTIIPMTLRRRRRWVVVTVSHDHS